MSTMTLVLFGAGCALGFGGLPMVGGILWFGGFGLAVVRVVGLVVDGE